MKLLRTIRFDGTDEKVFPRAAAADEIAVAGAFLFADDEPETLTGKRLQAFRSGFLGLESFGFSTFAAVAEVPDGDYSRAIELLAYRFFADLGAPDLETARAAAKDEVDYAASLCAHPVNTIVAVERELDEDGIKERFRTVAAPREKDHAKVWFPSPLGGEGQG